MPPAWVQGLRSGALCRRLARRGGRPGPRALSRDWAGRAGAARGLGAWAARRAAGAGVRLGQRILSAALPGSPTPDLPSSQAGSGFGFAGARGGCAGAPSPSPCLRTLFFPRHMALRDPCPLGSSVGGGQAKGRWVRDGSGKT